ncbi:MAG TPA: hypothetical protein VEB41_16380 [Burkholderiales bacterium]|nr:hypothetical protein [Burkholderiales bacterium]
MTGWQLALDGAPRRKWAIGGASLVALGLLGWGIFHPEFRPDTGVVSAAMLQEFSRTGFKPTRGVRAVRFESSQSIDAFSEAASSEQTIVPMDPFLTEKLTVRRAVGPAYETAGLYLGPLAVVRYHRTKPPIIGELLPFHFWSSSRLTGFAVQHVERFPGEKGGLLRARLTYEDRYPSGEVIQTENRSLECRVTAVGDAAAIVAGLSGRAARIECTEELEAEGRKVGPTNPQTRLEGRVAYTHWYVIDNHWSIPIEGEMAVRVHGSDSIQRWKSKVLSFERSGE